MKKNVLVRVGTGRTIHNGFVYEGEKGVYVSCGAIRHSGGQRREIFKTGEVTCKKCLKAMAEAAPAAQPVEEAEMSLREYKEKGISFYIKK